jgi:hypothetical protein
MPDQVQAHGGLFEQGAQDGHGEYFREDDIRSVTQHGVAVFSADATIRERFRTAGCPTVSAKTLDAPEKDPPVHGLVVYQIVPQNGPHGA